MPTENDRADAPVVDDVTFAKAYRAALAYAEREARKYRGWEMADRFHDAATDAVLRARAAFDPTKASFPTFCRLVVAARVHRAKQLAAAKAAFRPKVGPLPDDFDVAARPDPAPVEEFAGLPDDLRRAAELYYVDGHTLREGGEVLGITGSAFHRRLTRAAELLAGLGA